MLLQWHVKDPGHSAKSAGGRLHLNTHTSLTQRRPLTQQSWSWLALLLSRHSMGTYQETSSHATCQGTFSQSSQHPEQLWTDHGLKSGINVRKLIATLKKKKKAQVGNELSNILPKSSHARTKPSKAIISEHVW